MADKYWISEAPTVCDFKSHGLCRGNGSITNEFIDGKTIHGPWANMCPSCYDAYGVSLGIGYGQKYVKQPDGRFKKVAG